MKKKVLLLFTLIFIPLIVNAKTYDINEKKMHITIDDSFAVFTRENLENNPDFERMDVSIEAVNELLTKNNAYLYALNNDKSVEIYLRVKKAPGVDNLKNYSDDRLNSLAEDFAGKTHATKYDVLKNDYNFIYTNFKDSNYNMINYYTVVKEEGYTLTMQKKDAFNNNDEELMKEIVNSIKYDVKLKIEKQTNKNNKLFILGITILIFILLVVSYFIKLKKEREGFKTF